MKFKEIVARITGLSVPMFGVQWSPKEPEIAAARRVIGCYLRRSARALQPERDGEPGPLLQPPVLVLELLQAPSLTSTPPNFFFRA